MKVLYLHQYFATRSGFTGTRSYEFSKHLIGRGHDVTMITSGRRNVPELTTPPGRDAIEADVEGIRVVAINAAYNNPLEGTAKGGAKRMAEFLKFARVATRVGRTLPRPDVVIASHTPLTIGLAGAALGRHFGVPFVFEVRDVWPDALVNIGALKNRLVIWWMRRLARRIYSQAAHIIALSPGMKAGVVREGVADERVTVITNGCDLELFSPGLDGGPTRRRLGLGDGFVASYFGAMGRANGLDYVLDAARLLRDGGDRIRLVLHGQGGCRAALQARARAEGLSQVVFSDPVPDKAEVARLAAASNACMTIYAATNRETTWSPNKMFDALAAGRPVIINVPGWLGETIAGGRCGVFVDPQKPAALAEALRRLAADPAACAEMGRNARALAEREFSRDRLAGLFERVLADAVGKSRGGNPSEELGHWLRGGV